MRPRTWHRQYLGDSVYAGFDGYHVWLTTENGQPTDPSNAISLEDGVLARLDQYREHLSELARAGELCKGGARVMTDHAEEIRRLRALLREWRKADEALCDKPWDVAARNECHRATNRLRSAIDAMSAEREGEVE